MDAGTVLPYVKRAQSLGYEVLITNTNDNSRDGKAIPGHGSPEEHASTVWKTIVQPADAKSIAVVAHSYGGVVVTNLNKKFKDDFAKKVFAVAFTDSVHQKQGSESRLSNIGVNFVASHQAMGKAEKNSGNDMMRVSAGHFQHEMTSHACEFIEAFLT